MPAQPIVGLHHVTAIAGSPQRNLDFYTQVLGLRFVKKTVNFDDPGTYHFYFGDDAGRPGTILTFFPWPNARAGTRGAGEVIETAFSIPPGSAAYWQQRLAANKVTVIEQEPRLGETVVSFTDPDGMGIALVEHAETAPFDNPRFADVPVEHAIRGFYGVTLLERDATDTATALELLGFRKVAEDGRRLRFAAEGDALGNHLDILVNPSAAWGRPGAGSVHHIAFRSVGYEDQKEWREIISRHLSVSPVMERDYFRSIYFREPGGVLFELATDNPGFTLDEPLESLGEELQVPQWLAPNLAALSTRLVPVTLHKSTEVTA